MPLPENEKTFRFGLDPLAFSVRLHPAVLATMLSCMGRLALRALQLVFSTAFAFPVQVHPKHDEGEPG